MEWEKRSEVLGSPPKPEASVYGKFIIFSSQRRHYLDAYRIGVRLRGQSDTSSRGTGVVSSHFYFIYFR